MIAQLAGDLAVARRQLLVERALDVDSLVGGRRLSGGGAGAGAGGNGAGSASWRIMGEGSLSLRGSGSGVI